MGDAGALPLTGAPCVPGGVEEGPLTGVLVAVESVRGTETKAIRRGTAFASTLHQVAPVTAVKGEAAVGDAGATDTVST